MAQPRQAPYVICHLCGRKYGTKSIAIHEPNCLKKWHADNKKLPKHLRRKQPPPKPDYEMLTSGTFNGNALDMLNEMSYKAAQEQLIPCENCARTFLPERLAIHQRSCTSAKPAAAPKPGAKINGVRVSRNAGTANLHKNADIDDEERFSFLNKRPTTSKRTTTSPPKVHNSSSGNSNTMTCSFCDQEVPLIKIQAHLVQCNKEEKIPCGLCLKEIPSSQIQGHLMKCNKARLEEMKVKPSPRRQERVDSESENERPSTRTLHRGPPDENADSTRIESQRSSSGEGKNFQCDLCTYTCDTFNDFQRHRKKCLKGDKIKSLSIETSDTNHGSRVENTVECNFCDRKFAADRIGKHETICSKTTQKQRKVFDSSKQRIEGGLAPIKIQKETPGVPKSNWRQTHKDFVDSIRSAKKVKKHVEQGGKLSDLPPPPPSLNADYVHCQYCDRRFNPTVAERHIPKCATTRNRPKPPKQKALDVYKRGDPAGHASKQTRMSTSRGRTRSSPFQSFALDESTTARPKTQSNRTARDPYKSKTFKGLDNLRTGKLSSSYSYNAMNRTNANFFG